MARCGRRCLPVTGPKDTALAPVYRSILARAEKCDVVLRVGGGSRMDAAKAVVVGATQGGSARDNRFTWESAGARFAVMGRILARGLEGLGVPRADVPYIADHSRENILGML